MDDSNSVNANLANDVRYLRDVVEKTKQPSVNRYWTVTLFWGCVIVIGYAVCMAFGMAGKVSVLPWVWPVLIAIAWPTDWYLRRKVRSRIEATGVRPRRKELIACWLSIVAVGMLWNAALIINGSIATQWGLLCFVWGSLYLVGFVINTAMLSNEWWAAAAIQLASMIIAYITGPDYYWLPGVAIGFASVVAGVLGRRRDLREPLAA